MTTTVKTSGKAPLDGTLGANLLILLELLWIFIRSIPITITAIYSKFFPGDGKDLTGKIVLVTGAGNGLGKELALQFARHGCRVVCVDVREADNTTTVDDIRYETKNKERAKGYICDVSDTASVERLRKAVLADWGHVDILVNNAGIIYGNTFTTGTEQNIRRVVDINLLGSYWVTRAFLPDMKKRNQGHVVFINSMSALTALANGTIYSTTKYGMLGMAQALDDELRQEMSNVKLSSVHPYFIATQDVYKDMFQTRIPPMTTQEAVRQIITGIRREYFTFQVPGYELGFTFSSSLSLLPRKLYYMWREMFAVNLILPKDDSDYKNIPGKDAKDCDSYVQIKEMGSGVLKI